MNIQTERRAPASSRARPRPTSPCCASSATSCAAARSARCSPTDRRHRRRSPVRIRATASTARSRSTRTSTLGGYYAQTEHARPVTATTTATRRRFDYAADRYGARAEYLKVGDNFNPEVGFVRRDDFAALVRVAALQSAAAREHTRSQVHLRGRASSTRERRRRARDRVSRRASSTSSWTTATGSTSKCNDNFELAARAVPCRRASSFPSAATTSTT